MGGKEAGGIQFDSSALDRLRQARRDLAPLLRVGEQARAVEAALTALTTVGEHVAALVGRRRELEQETARLGEALEARRLSEEETRRDRLAKADHDVAAAERAAEESKARVGAETRAFIIEQEAARTAIASALSTERARLQTTRAEITAAQADLERAADEARRRDEERRTAMAAEVLMWEEKLRALRADHRAITERLQSALRG